MKQTIKFGKARCFRFSGYVMTYTPSGKVRAGVRLVDKR